MTDTATSPRYLTPEQVAERIPTGNADWVRKQLRSGALRGSKIKGSWWVEEAAIDDMVAAASNTAGRSRTSRRRRQRVIA